MSAEDAASGYQALEDLSREGWMVAVCAAEAGFAHRPAGDHIPDDWLMLSARPAGDRGLISVFGPCVAEAAPKLVALCHEAAGVA